MTSYCRSEKPHNYNLFATGDNQNLLFKKFLRKRKYSFLKQLIFLFCFVCLVLFVVAYSYRILYIFVGHCWKVVLGTDAVAH